MRTSEGGPYKTKGEAKSPLRKAAATKARVTQEVGASPAPTKGYGSGFGEAFGEEFFVA